MAGDYRGIEVFGRASGASSSTHSRSRSGGRDRRPVRTAQKPRRRARIGAASAIAGGATVLCTASGITAAMFGHFEPGILLAYLSTGTSVVAVLCGVVSVLTARGRAWGALGLVLGVLASPPVLTKVLGWASGLG